MCVYILIGAHIVPLIVLRWNFSFPLNNVLDCKYYRPLPRRLCFHPVHQSVYLQDN